MTKVAFITLRIILYMIPLAIVYWSASQYFAFSGIQQFTYDFSKESPFVSILWPPDRTSDIYRVGTDYMQDIKEDPTSFSIQLTRPDFSTARISITYKKREDVPLRLGLQKGDGSWDFFFKDLVVTKAQEDEWNTATVLFDIAPEYITPARKLNILISSPYLSDTNSTITISALSVELKKDPINLGQVLGRLGIFL